VIRTVPVRSGLLHVACVKYIWNCLW